MLVDNFKRELENVDLLISAEVETANLKPVRSERHEGGKEDETRCI